VGLSHLLFVGELPALMKNLLELEDLLFYVMNLDHLVYAVNHLKVCLNAVVFQPSASPQFFYDFNFPISITASLV
jgi:hypothetical protein